MTQEKQPGPERLHAPWRMEYVTGADGPHDGCVFCHADGACERDRFVIHRGETAYVILNAYPYNSGHVMVIPYLHTHELDELPAETLAEMMLLARRTVRVLKRLMAPEGFNIGMNLGRPAGAGIADHLHLHIVPRWTGDTNFMPVVGNTRVLPESLEKTWERLSAAFAQRDDEEKGE